MNRTAELERQVSFGDVATSVPARETARIVPLRQPAPSDRAAGMEAVAGNGSAALQRGLVTPADIATGDTIPSNWSSSYAVYQAARTNRAFVLGELAAVAMQIVADFVRDMAERYRRSRRESAAREALSQLDDRTLHDLGIDRSEIASVAAEAAGKATLSRVNAVRV
jgi:uncharacterized protein YjiS (DUF1127 family)